MRLLILTWETKCQKFKPRFANSWQGKNTEHAGQGKKAESIAIEVAKAYGPLRKCFNCNSPKHIARDYPEKKHVSKNKPYTVKKCLVVDIDVSLETSFEKLTDVVDCALRTQCGDVNRVSNVDDCCERDVDTGDLSQLMNINIETVVESEAVNCIDVIDNTSFKAAALKYVDVLIDARDIRLWKTLVVRYL